MGSGLSGDEFAEIRRGVERRTYGADGVPIGNAPRTQENGPPRDDTANDDVPAMHHVSDDTAVATATNRSLDSVLTAWSGSPSIANSIDVSDHWGFWSHRFLVYLTDNLKGIVRTEPTDPRSAEAHRRDAALAREDAMRSLANLAGLCLSILTELEQIDDDD